MENHEVWLRLLDSEGSVTGLYVILAEDKFSMPLFSVCFSLPLSESLYIEHLASPNCYDRGVGLEYMAYI